MTDKNVPGSAPPSADEIAVDYVHLLAALAVRRKAADDVVLSRMAYAPRRILRRERSPIGR
jgi:hypothetical protein